MPFAVSISTYRSFGNTVKNSRNFSGGPKSPGIYQGYFVEIWSFVPAKVTNFFFVLAMKQGDTRKNINFGLVHDWISKQDPFIRIKCFNLRNVY